MSKIEFSVQVLTPLVDLWIECDPPSVDAACRLWDALSSYSYNGECTYDKHGITFLCLPDLVEEICELVGELT